MTTRRTTDEPEQSEPPVVEPEPELVPEFTLSGSAVKATNLPEDLQSVEVDFSFDEDTIKATYSGLPEEYTAKTNLYLGSAIVGLMKGRLESVKGDDWIGFKFGTGYATSNVYKFEFRGYNKTSRTYTTISTQEFTVKAVEKE